MPKKTFVLALLAILVPALAGAQSVYTWKDERGIIHFSDAAPEGAKNVQKRSVENLPPLNTADQAAETPEPEAEETPAAPSTPTLHIAPSNKEAEGPARIVLMEQHSTPEGAQTRHLTGKLKNVGGDIAEDVGIKIKVTDANQGSVCLTTEADAKPTTLEGGKEAEYDQYVDSPCFLGDFAIEVTPLWQ